MSTLPRGGLTARNTSQHKGDIVCKKFFLILQTALIVLLASSSCSMAQSDFRRELEKVTKGIEDTSISKIDWYTDLVQAASVSKKSNRPMFIWVMDGHPLGCT